MRLTLRMTNKTKTGRVRQSELQTDESTNGHANGMNGNMPCRLVACRLIANCSTCHSIKADGRLELNAIK